MITREDALERARDYLGRGPRVQLKVSEGWPDGVYRPFGGAPEAVWAVFVASDVRGVGAGHYVIIDGTSGEVVTDQWCGE